MDSYTSHDGTTYTEIDGSANWPDWSGVETCACGAELPDDCSGSCTTCGMDLWMLVAPMCDECGKVIYGDDNYWLCADGGETYCQDCMERIKASDTPTPSTFSSMAQVRAANRAAGQHWFDPSSMRFFDSKIGRTLIHGRYFISSEQFHGSDGYTAAREYTIRRVENNGHIETIGRMGQYPTAAQARRAAARLHPEASPCANCRQPTYNANFTCSDCASPQDTPEALAARKARYA